MQTQEQTILIERKKKKLVARIILYFCIFNYELEDFKEYIYKKNYALLENIKENINHNFFSLQLYKNPPRKFDIDDFVLHLRHQNLLESVSVLTLYNGETVNVEVMNQEIPMFVVAFTSSGVAFSNQVYIKKDSNHKKFAIETKYSFKLGINLTIYEEKEKW